MTESEFQGFIDDFILDKALLESSAKLYQLDLNFLFAATASSGKLDFSILNSEKILDLVGDCSRRIGQRRATNIRCFLLWLGEKKLASIDQRLALPWRFKAKEAKQSPKAQSLSAANLELLLADNETLKPAQRLLLALLAFTGASLEEISQLRWLDLSLGRKSHITLGRKGRMRVLPIDPNLVDLIEESRKQAKSAEFVFCKGKGEKTEPVYLATAVRRLAKKIFGLDLSPVDLQDYAERSLIEKDGLFFAREMVGRKKLASLVKKSKFDLGVLRRIHEKVFEVLEG